MWAIFQSGGPVMYPLALLSVVAVAVTIEKLITLQGSRVIQGDVVSCIESIQTPADIPLAVKICERFDTPFANIIRAGLAEAGKPLHIVRQEMEDVGRREIKRLERYMVFVETAAAAGPLLGLLGTVTGMVRVFSVISISGVGQSGALSGGIAEALVTTVFGLIIGVPSLIAYNLLNARIDGLLNRIDAYGHQLLKRLGSMQGAAQADDGMDLHLRKG
jgi:biopolymer transport protein ExbB